MKITSYKNISDSIIFLKSVNDVLFTHGNNTGITINPCFKALYRLILSDEKYVTSILDNKEGQRLHFFNERLSIKIMEQK